MSKLNQTVKALNLTEFYFSLSISDKSNFAKYSHYLSCCPEKVTSCQPDCDGCFMVTNGAQFLWATAANAIPEGKLDFAEKLLTYALKIADDPEDFAWIHANLAQVYYDKHKTEPEAGRKSIGHCRELLKLGYMKSWAQNLMQELIVFHV